MATCLLVDDVCPEEWCVKLTKPENIVGMQGQLFSETILSEENFYYMVFPRLLALAERAWHKVFHRTLQYFLTSQK